jgi:hypothetical protein
VLIEPSKTLTSIQILVASFHFLSYISHDLSIAGFLLHLVTPHPIPALLQPHRANASSFPTPLPSLNAFCIEMGQLVLHIK